MDGNGRTTGSLTQHDGKFEIHTPTPVAAWTHKYKHPVIATAAVQAHNIPALTLADCFRLVLVVAVLQHSVKTITGNKKEFRIRLCFSYL